VQRECNAGEESPPALLVDGSSDRSWMVPARHRLLPRRYRVVN